MDFGNLFADSNSVQACLFQFIERLPRPLHFTSAEAHIKSCAEIEKSACRPYAMTSV
jgi:hypothetical protein